MYLSIPVQSNKQLSDLSVLCYVNGGKPFQRYLSYDVDPVFINQFITQSHKLFIFAVFEKEVYMIYNTRRFSRSLQQLQIAKMTGAYSIDDSEMTSLDVVDFYMLKDGEPRVYLVTDGSDFSLDKDEQEIIIKTIQENFNVIRDQYKGLNRNKDTRGVKRSELLKQWCGSTYI